MDTKPTSASGLSRQLGLVGLAATGICSMLGASIYVVPFMIQRSVPGIGPYVVPAFMLAAVPAILAALCYASLASVMPRAGGSYVYASRGLSPYLGFVASFSQWFGLCIAIGVVSYVIPPFFRDICTALDYPELSRFLDTGWIRVSVSLLLLWTFVLINIRGAKAYERTVIPLMILMFALGIIVIIAGFSFDHEDFQRSLTSSGQFWQPNTSSSSSFSWNIIWSGAAVLFASFIGFDSIAQAGGEAKHPQRNLPLAIGISVGVVGSFYLLFTLAVYHAVPWQFIADEAARHDITAPALMRYFLSPGWTVAMVAGAAVALTNDLPAMLLSVSRLMFSWAEDGMFPIQVTRIHPRYQTPHVALVISGCVASLGILGSHLAGDFFLGVDILVTSMLVNFLLMAVTLLMIRKRNPDLASAMTLFRSPMQRLFLGWISMIALLLFLVIHVQKDLTAEVPWYLHTTLVWIAVMITGSIIFIQHWRSSVDPQEKFSRLPPE
ncbi:MAG TPA: APC family permease [Cyclobacteriaceae bacterium]|nr:APC family permease [Cyclobacteriaceae bacterium]